MSKKRLTTLSFIKKALKVHSNRYDYSETFFIDSKNKVSVVCKSHGMFSIMPGNHLQGQGCKLCWTKKQADSKRKTLAQFVHNAERVHGKLYDYSYSDYRNNCISVNIKCGVHGFFKQRPSNHINGSGCPKCGAKRSKGEEAIVRFLKKIGTVFESEKVFNSCRYKRVLPFDFYIPEYRLLIEYDGEQHFYPIRRGKKYLVKLEDIKKRDFIKTEWAKNNNYNLLRISFKEFTRIPEILSERLKRAIC